MGIGKYIIMLGVGLASLATAQTINLEPRRYDDLVMSAHTEYVGTVDKEFISELKRDLVVRSWYVGVTNPAHTYLVSPRIYENGVSVSGCQMEFPDGNAPYTMSDSSFENCLIVTTQKDSSGNGLLFGNQYSCSANNNVILGFDSGVMVMPMKSSELELEKFLALFQDNFFGWCNIGMTSGMAINMGDDEKHGNNIFYRNEMNISNDQPRKETAKHNWFYDKDGNFLGDAVSIRPTLRGRNKSIDDLIDFIPFQVVPFGEVLSGVGGWGRYE